MKPFRVPIALACALAAGVAVAQEPPAPVPKLPAMPSLEQKGSDDMTKPAGAMPPAPAVKSPKPAATEPKHAGKDQKKHEPDAPKGKPKPTARSKAPTKATTKHAVTPPKGRKPAPGRPRKRR